MVKTSFLVFTRAISSMNSLELNELRPELTSSKEVFTESLSSAKMSA